MISPPYRRHGYVTRASRSCLAPLLNFLHEYCKGVRYPFAQKGDVVPSAKMTIWNEAMYYFLLAPAHYQKILFVLKDIRISNQESLAEYYIRTYAHFIPKDVTIWEYDAASGQANIVNRQGRKL